MSQRDEGPVYYREIQKNAYLKRVPNENTGSKLLLSHKKPPLKAMWTQFCIHNGRLPYLEQYPEAESPHVASHRPTWRASLRSARHVTAGLRPTSAGEFQFLIDTDHGPVRMLAPDWDSMQDWVSTLRCKLQELKIVCRGENVYQPPPAPRAAARDPTSPLPPTPLVPLHRVPGIEIVPPRITQPETQQSTISSDPPSISTDPPLVSRNPETVSRDIHDTRGPSNISRDPTNVSRDSTAISRDSTNVSRDSTAISRDSTTVSRDSTANARDSTAISRDPIVSRDPTIVSRDPTNISSDPEVLESSPSIDISNWEDDSTPSTSHGTEIPKSVTKICGQNICLDDSILKRKVTTDSDEEFFAEIDRINQSVENMHFDEEYKVDFKQRVLVNDDCKKDELSDKPTNITVIQVSNKPPHTAIPLLGTETNVFNYDFKTPIQNGTDFINIVNTENGYGTVYKESEYGHLSLTTTVNLTGENTENNEGVYERLCLASTSQSDQPLPSKLGNKVIPLPSKVGNKVDQPLQTGNKVLPLPSKVGNKVLPLKDGNKVRKSSLPNLEVNDSTYEYLFPNNNKNRVVVESSSEVNSNVTVTNTRLNSDVNSVTVNESTAIINTNETRPTNTPSIESTNRGSVERSQSQTAYDRRCDVIRPHLSPKRRVKNDESEPKPEYRSKPPWRRGLTELSLLSRLRGITQRNDVQEHDRSVTSPVKVVHRSRGQSRGDSTRRRSSSLTNAPPVPPVPRPPLLSLRMREAASLRADQRRGAAIVGTVRVADPPIFTDYNRQVWVCSWGAGSLSAGRGGDRAVSVRGTILKHAQHAKQLIKSAHTPVVDILFHRVPLGKIYVINKRDLETIGIKLDNECCITSIDPLSPAARSGVPVGWAVTHVNNRQINLIKGGEEEMNRLSLHGTEVTVLVQPVTLVKKIRATLKSSRNILSLR